MEGPIIHLELFILPEQQAKDLKDLNIIWFFFSMKKVVTAICFLCSFSDGDACQMKVIFETWSIQDEAYLTMVHSDKLLIIIVLNFPFCVPLIVWLGLSQWSIYVRQPIKAG